MYLSSSPLRVGITGGIGCGKSTVLAVFEQLGVPCFVADKVAAAYYDDALFVKQVVGLFGESILQQEGHVDKKALAAIVFADPGKLAQLNDLVHPRVHADFEAWCSRQTSAYVLFESAILYESGFDKAMDQVVCVYLEKEERIRRLAIRDKASRAEIESRINNQLSAESKMEKADWVILNYEGNPRERQVRYLDSVLRSMSSI